MSILSFEKSLASRRAEFVLHAAAVAGLGAFLLWTAPMGRGPALLGLAGLGLLCWSLLEYGWHRFVMHRIEPLARWHRAHHQRPTALLGVPAVVCALALALLVLLPAWWLLGALHASAFSLGLLTGGFAYTLMHEAVHREAIHGLDLITDTDHRPPRFDWLRYRAAWHTQHHQSAQPCCFGVTTTLWDHLFRTTGSRG